MKLTITKRLIGYFIIVLMGFALMLMGVFYLVNQRQNQQTIETRLFESAEELQRVLQANRSLSLARTTLEGILNRVALDDTQAWLVDERGQLTVLSPTRMGMMRARADITPTTQALIDQVLAGQRVLDTRLSGVFDRETTTVGVPLVQNGRVVAALFVSASNQAIAAVAASSMRILGMALVLSMGLVVVLGYVLSLSFVRPLHRATQAIDQLAQGNTDVYVEPKGDAELVQLSHNLNRLSERLQASARERDDLERMRRAFIADITHELRTPMTVIRGWVESLRDGIIPLSEAKTLSHQILHETHGMERLIQDLLDLSKLEDPSFSMHQEPLSLNALWHDLERSAQALAQAKNLEVVSHGPQDALEFVGDAQRLKQMVMIVIDNAVKFSPEHASIELSFEGDANAWSISVRDVGPGLSSEQQAQLFQRYKTNNQAGGNGLGLLIAKHIAQGHHLDLTVSSAHNQGACFTFTYPDQKTR